MNYHITLLFVFLLSSLNAVNVHAQERMPLLKDVARPYGENFTKKNNTLILNS